MQLAPIVLPGCTYGIWVAQRTLAVRAVRDCAPRFSRHTITNQLQTQKETNKVYPGASFYSTSFPAFIACLFVGVFLL